MIEEKTLVKFMKAAYTGGGLNVWRLEWRSIDTLYINSGYWAVLIPMSCAPSKVLALITEYLRRLPLIGECYRLMKKTEPESLTAGRGEQLLDSADEGAYSLDCKLTPFFIGDKRVFQQRSLQLLTVSADLLALLNDRQNMGRTTSDGGSMLWHDADTDEWVWIPTRRDYKESELRRLRGQDFWRELT